MIQLDAGSCIQAGKCRFHLESGFYAYVGSALSGLERRLARHLRAEKRFHWHIDYLLNMARINEIIYGETGESKECALAEILSQRLPAINGFGSSDCKCPSHLFYSKDRNDLKNIIFEAFMRLVLDPYMLVGQNTISTSHY